MRVTRVGLRVAVAAAMVSAAMMSGVQPVTAQSVLLPGGPERGVGMEVMHPDFKGFEVTVPSTVWHLSGRLPIGERFRLIGDIPFAHARFKGDELELGSSTVLGNPLVGVEFLTAPGVRLELSGRAPLTTADSESFADVIGALADLQRAESFMIDALPISAMVTLERSLRPGLDLRARAGTTTIFDIGDDEESESSSVTSIDYGVFGTYTAGIARFGTGVSGRWDASADEGSFSERSLHQVGFTADVKVGRVRPGVAVRVPLDRDYRDILGSAIGIYLQAPLP